MISIKNLTYYYPNSDIPALDNISLEIQEGEFILLLGPSGCGKSTLIQCLNGIVPKVTGGELQGDIFVNGKNVTEKKVYQLASDVGIVFQNPDTQLFGLTVEEDVAFGPENLGIEREEIKKRVERSLKIVNIEKLKKRFTFTLSGGEKQRTAIAGNVVMQPKILVLDEPTSDLDPAGTKQVLETVKQLNTEMAITTILVEHKLDEVIELADRTIVMDKGKIILDGKTFDIFTQNYDILEKIGVCSPQLIQLSKILKVEPSYNEILSNLQKLKWQFTDLPDNTVSTTKTPYVIFEDVFFEYRDGTESLKGIDLSIEKGDFIALIGSNGSGKTTLLSCLIGLLKPTKGKILINGQDIIDLDVPELAQMVGYLFQNPDYQLFTDTVSNEVSFGLKNRLIVPTDVDQKVSKALEIMELSDYRERHPHSLSRGQRQRVAVASVLSMEPNIIVLDEPTTGQDRGHINKFLEIMKELKTTGKTIILITHDMKIVTEFANRTIVMDKGKIILDGTTRDVFSKSTILEKCSIEPPLVTKLCNDLNKVGLKIPNLLTINELSDLIHLPSQNQTVTLTLSEDHPCSSINLPLPVLKPSRFSSCSKSTLINTDG